MTKHAPGARGKQPVRDGHPRREAKCRVIETYDSTTLVGLYTIVYAAAVERINQAGEVTVELPKLRELLASAAIVRCLMPVRLRGHEIKAMRKIMGLTLSELAGRLDERTAPETVSRWETEAQPMGGYAEKVLRLLICEDQRDRASGISYDAAMISRLRVIDPWRAEPDYQVPAIELGLVRMKEPSGTLIDAWDQRKAA